MYQRELKEHFQMRVSGTADWYPMTVPGSAMESFVKAGRLPDPYYGTNEYGVRDFFRNDFDIRGVFEASEEECERAHVELVFHGIDTVGDVFLNGIFLGHVENMHRIYRFSVKEVLQPGENLLEIHLQSPITFVEAYQPEKGREIHMVNVGSMKGAQYIRKPHCMFGWDWGPQLPDVGIFRKITLCSWEKVRLLETYVRQEHGEKEVKLRFETKLEGEKERASVIYELSDPEGNLLYRGEKPEVCVENPKLWWPCGSGEQPLYMLKISLSGERDEEEWRERIGLRTVTVSREEDQWGEEFAIVVNGVKIFAKGADYIPDDCFYSRITREILERDVKAAVFANFNCLRVWGGGFYPSEEFFDLCDEYGILIWQDLMYACNIYELTPEFIENIQAETRDNLLRIRNHASLALICGNNEMETAWVEWKAVEGHAPSLKRDYLLQFEYILPEVVRKTAPDTFYWPSSPSSGGSFDCPGDENRGDCHYWDVWHGQLPFSEYLKHYFRFCSEFGFQSLPSMKTIETFTEEKDRNLFSKVMESHQKNGAANGKILYYLSETFRYPKDLSGLVFLSQILQGYAMKAAVDHWRRNRGRCMGSIYWQFNDNWPVASWSSMDYYGRYKALHYMARSFYAPVAGSIQKEGAAMSFWISNESMDKTAVTARMTLKTLEFTVLDETELSAEVPPLTAKCLLTRDFSELILGREDRVFVVVEYEYQSRGKVRKEKEFEIFVPMKHLELEDPSVQVEAADEKIRLTAKSFVPYCMVEGTERDLIFDKNVVSITGKEGEELLCQEEKISREELRIYDVYHTY